MKIYLPSNGLLGLTSVDMRTPRISDIRTLTNLSDNEILFKTEFLYQLVDKEVLDRVTPSDRDYLFFIAASAFSLNVFNYSVTCKCGKHIHAQLYSGQVDPIRLRHNEKSVVEKSVAGEVYKFHRLNVGEESKCIFFAMDAPDDQYDDIYTDAVVAMTLYKDVNPELIERVQHIDIAIYYFAYFYQQFLPHGVDIRTEVVCECGEKITVLHPIKSSLINTDIKTMMNCFVSLGDRLTLEDFYNMTLPEYNLYVQSLNQKLKQQDSY